MPLHLREDSADDLDPEEVDANWKSLYDVPATAFIVNGVIAVNGQGRYIIDVEGGAAATDEVTQITGLPAGQVAWFQSVSSDRQITFIHGPSIKLENGTSFTLETVRCKFKVRSANGAVVEEELRKFIPD